MASSDDPISAGESDKPQFTERYNQERDRRLRADGTGQFIHAAGRYAHFLDDPWVSEKLVRAPLREAVDVFILGAGFGGMSAAYHLMQAGVTDVRLADKAGDFGGTWYWNRYPGAACDTESYIYMPLLEEMGYVPTRKYAPAAEIYEYCRRVGQRFGLYEKALFQTEVLEVRWQEDAARWRITTDRGDDISARFIIQCAGRLQRPQLPGIPGIETFKGRSFHASRWDYGYTGGGPKGGLTGLADKRVGIIGTGATCVQALPHLGEWCKELYLFQRTPAPVDWRNDRPTDPAWERSLDEGWQKARMENFSAVISGLDVAEDMVNDGWTDLIPNVRLAAAKRIKAGHTVDDPAAVVAAADEQRMNRMRARIDAVVSDPAVAEALKPWYLQACKRPCFHDAYLDTFNRPNVTLVDTEGRGVERITEGGVVANGREYALDCLIYATGFEYNTDYTRRAGLEVYGRGGLALSEKWKDGAATLHGACSRGFPNCFFIALMQSGHSANASHMINENAHHIAYIISQAMARQARSVEPTADAEADWVDFIVAGTAARLPILQACTPGYINNEGVFEMRERRNSQWTEPTRFVQLLASWREAGEMEGLELTP